MGGRGREETRVACLRELVALGAGLPLTAVCFGHLACFCLSGFSGAEAG